VGTIRRAAIEIAVLVLCGALGSGLMWFYAWDGSSAYDEFQSGDVIELRNEVSITVPSGWDATLTTYSDLPVWVPFRANRQTETREIVTVRGARRDSSPRVLAIVTYFDGVSPPGLAGASVVASAPGTNVFDVAGESRGAIIEIEGEGSPTYVMLTSTDADALTAARQVWDLLGIDGATRPCGRSNKRIQLTRTR